MSETKYAGDCEHEDECECDVTRPNRPAQDYNASVGYWSCTCGSGMTLRAVTLSDYQKLQVELVAEKDKLFSYAFTILPAKDAEIESLQSKVSELETQIMHKDAALKLHQIKVETLEKLQSSLESAREVIDFYSERVKIDCQHDDPSWCTNHCNDYGARAREWMKNENKT